MIHRWSQKVLSAPFQVLVIIIDTEIAGATQITTDKLLDTFLGFSIKQLCGKFTSILHHFILSPSALKLRRLKPWHCSLSVGGFKTSTLTWDPQQRSTEAPGDQLHHLCLKVRFFPVGVKFKLAYPRSIVHWSNVLKISKHDLMKSLNPYWIACISLATLISSMIYFRTQSGG